MDAFIDYLIPALVAALVIEILLWRQRRKSGERSNYLSVASACRAAGYSPAFYTATHGAVVLPWYAATGLMLGERGFFELLAYNTIIAAVCFLVFAGCIALRRRGSLQD